MSNTQPARRLNLLCALAIASAATLSGCSWLKHDAESLSYVGAENISDREKGIPTENTEREGPTWSLETLQAAENALAQPPLSFEHAWYLAVKNDPAYQAALSGRAAAQIERQLGRAAILPQVQAGYSRRKITGLQRNFTALGTSEGELSYDSTSTYIQLQQPLFNVDRYAQYKRGQARAQLGEAEFAVMEYEAAMRLVKAYLEVVRAQGRTRLSQLLVDSLEEQARTQATLYELNEASSVDAQETEARLAIARADLIAAEDMLKVARRHLQSLIGEDTPELGNIDTLNPAALVAESGGLVGWLEKASANSATIRRAHANVRVADTEVQRAVGRHLPTADLVVSWVDADSENLETLSQASNTFQAGVQVNIPIFSGGYDTANHARSRHLRRQAEQELVQAEEVVAAEITRQFTAVEGGALRIEALESSVESAEQSLEAAKRGYEFGVNSNLDVLRRQDRLFQARFELLEARVTWIDAYASLAAAAGEPVWAVVTALDNAIGPASGRR